MTRPKLNLWTFIPIFILLTAVAAAQFVPAPESDDAGSEVSKTTDW